METKITLRVIELRGTLLKNSDRWRTHKMSVGEWVGKIAVEIIKNKTHDNAVYNWTVKMFGPTVSYNDMVALIKYIDHNEDFQCAVEYNPETKVWEVQSIRTSSSFKKAMDSNCYRHEIWVPKITVGEIFDGLIYGTGDTESKTIAQWILQASEEKIKEYCNREDLKDTTVTMKSFLNLMGCGTLYSWEDIERILRLSDYEDMVIFALDVQGANIKIANMELPDTMKDAIKKVHEEKEESKKLHREFSVGEMFTGLVLSKDYTVKLSYVEWLARAVQNLLNVKKEMTSDFSIHCTHGTKISFRDAIDDFVTHNEAGDRFRVVYSLSDEDGEEGNSAIKFYDIIKVEE